MDERFRRILPDKFNEDIKKFLKNPGCSCNHPIYKKIITQATNELSKYYPDRLRIDTAELQQEAERVSQNNWTVINCSINELSDRLRKLPPGRKQLDIARYEDQVTVVINELDASF